MIDDSGRPLRIGVDGYNLALPHGTGVATYGRTLAAAIRAGGAKLDLIYGVPVSPKAPVALRETLFYGRLSEDGARGKAWPRSFRQKLQRWSVLPLAQTMLEIPVGHQVVTEEFGDRVPPFDRLFTKGFIYDIAARHFRRYGTFLTLRIPNPPDIMHWTYPVPVRMAGSRNVYTIHDLVPLRLPHTSLEDKSYYQRLIRACIEQAAHIVTVSEASRRDIVTMFDVAPDHVTNTYQPFEPSAAATMDADMATRRLKRLFDLDRDGYLLFFGAIEPKKNVGRLIEAYLSSEIDRPLVIVGGNGWKSEQELRLLNGAHGTMLPGAARIRRIDYLPRSMLMEVVRGARLVAFPSLYEGFGLPALEAMAAGVPLLTSNTSSLPEIVGTAAMTIDPYDIAALTAALRLLDGDDALRARLAHAGTEQAAKFGNIVYRPAIAGLYRHILSRTAKGSPVGRATLGFAE